MEFQAFYILRVAIMMLFIIRAMLTSDVKEGISDDFCLNEIFQPQCLKSEVILMKSATYGRMRIGRCITADEVKTLGSRYMGCSADILALLDRKCSGMTECTVRIIDISTENVKPCAAGLSVYLEASYECINIADEKRSCVADVSSTAIHLIGSKTCGTKSQPWIVEAPVGQKISISLIVFPTANSTQTRRNIQQPCQSHGAIVDKTGKTNVTICASGNQREKKLHLSAGSSVEIFLNSLDLGRSGDDPRAIISLYAVGCSDIIPPEDAYLKRSGDTVVVGCYTSRKSWHLNCEDGKWIGVIGNCSQGILPLEVEPKSERTAARVNNEQVLVITSLGGLTLAVSLSIICFGIVCLRRSYAKKKVEQEYKTLSYPFNATGVQPIDSEVIHPYVAADLIGNDGHRMVAAEPMPTYSVFNGEDNISHRWQ